MRVLEREDRLCLEAAQGWLALGNSHEAAGELERVTPPCRVHPEVLEMRWQVLGSAGKWWQCLRLAEKLIQRHPGRANGWVFLAMSLHKVRLTEEAVDNLIEVVHDFPETPVIAYELARYSCCLRQWREAWHWLEEACLAGNPQTIQSMVLDDPDMEPLRRRCGLEA